MSRATSPIVPKYSTEPVFPLSVEQYHEMIRMGVLSDDDPVELIEGVLVFHMPKNPPHRMVTRAVFDVLSGMLPPGLHCQMQDPVTLEDGEPEPDVSLIRGASKDFSQRHPGPREVLLVIEVADSTVARDRGMKLRSYARAGIVEYWIINLEARQIEVYTQPDPSGSEPRYASRTDIPESEAAPVVVDGIRLGEVNLRSILP